MSSRQAPGWPRKLRYLAEYALVRGVAALALLLPARAVLAIGRMAGTLVWSIDARHRRVAEDNLRQAFGPALTPPSRRRLARRTFQRFGEALGEFLLLPRIQRSKPGTWVEVRGLEHLRSARQAGDGALLVSGHYGNWEVAAFAQALIGMPMVLVVRPLDNPWLERWFTRMRALSGNRVVPKRRALRELLPALGRGESVALMIDQNVRGDGGVFVDFFGQPASTTAAIGLLALKRKSPIVPVFSVPLGGGRHRLEFEEPIRPRLEAPNRRAEVTRLAREATARLEARIRQRPELWLWMHERWRTRPHQPEVATPAVAPAGERRA